MVEVLVKVDCIWQIVELSSIVFVIRLRLRASSVTLIMLSMLALIFLLYPLIFLILVVENSVFNLERGHKAGIVPEKGTLGAHY